MTPRLLSTVAAVAAALPLVAAGPAAADSIVYVKDRNVWIANPDGTGNRQVTFDGAEYRSYIDPTQSDDGTIWAGRGNDIVKLDQQGTVLASWDAPATVDSVGHVLDDVPQDLAVSPDGGTLAFTYYQYSCPVGADCTGRTTTVFSHADRLTPPEELGHELNARNPAWADDTTVLLFGGHGRQVSWDTVGTGEYDARHWFDDAGNEDLGDGAISAAGDRLALVRSYGSGTHLQILAVHGRTEAPIPACQTGTDSSLRDPEWSPDGTRLAFEQQEGIEVMALPSVVDGDCPGAQSGVVTISGGTQPDWGPADVQPRYEVSADVAKGTRLGPALKKGLKLIVTTNVAGRLAGRVLVGGKPVATGAASLRSGAGTITFRFTKQARRALAKRKKAALDVDLTFKAAGAAPIPVTGTVTVRR